MKAERAGEQRVWGPLQIPMMALVTCETSLMLFSLVISRSRTPATVCLCVYMCVCVCVCMFFSNLSSQARSWIIYGVPQKITSLESQMNSPGAEGWWEEVKKKKKKKKRKQRGRPDHPPVCVFWYVYVTAFISPDFSSWAVSVVSEMKRAVSNAWGVPDPTQVYWSPPIKTEGW